MTREVNVNGIMVTIVRKRVKNVNYRITSDGKAQMSVPLHLTWTQAEEYARSRAQWFAEHMKKTRARTAPAGRLWEQGETVLLWGEPLRLAVRLDAGQRFCEVVGDELVLHVAPDDDAKVRAAVVDRWYGSELVTRLEVLLPQCEERVGKHASHITLRRMKSRWGSCTSSTARIRLNIALAEFAPECLEMVLVHELCHLWEANHSPRFYALMDLHCPGWRAAKRILDAHKP